MGVRVLFDDSQSWGSQACLYSSSTDWAFGPVFQSRGSDDHDARERAEAFLRWLGDREPRRMTNAELEHAYGEWLAQEAAQWKAEQDAEDAKWADDDPMTV